LIGDIFHGFSLVSLWWADYSAGMTPDGSGWTVGTPERICRLMVIKRKEIGLFVGSDDDYFIDQIAASSGALPELYADSFLSVPHRELPGS
jgi:hypothetical protein